MYRHLARCAGIAAVALAAAWPISVYTAYGWGAALVHAPIAAAIYICCSMPWSCRCSTSIPRATTIRRAAIRALPWWRKSALFCIIKPENFCRAGCLKTCRWFRFGWGCRWLWRLICWCLAGFAVLQADRNKVQAAFHRPETPIQPTDVYIRGAAFEHELPLQKQPALSNKLNLQ